MWCRDKVFSPTAAASVFVFGARHRLWSLKVSFVIKERSKYARTVAIKIRRAKHTLRLRRTSLCSARDGFYNNVQQKYYTH